MDWSNKQPDHTLVSLEKTLLGGKPTKIQANIRTTRLPSGEDYYRPDCSNNS